MREAYSLFSRWGHKYRQGPSLKSVLLQGPGKLGSHVQEPLLLREFRGMMFRKKKGGKGTRRAGAGSGVGGERGNNTVGRTKDLKKAGLEHGRRQA